MKQREKLKMPLMVRQALKALQIAFAKVIEDHRRRGQPIMIWKNGKATWVDV